MAQVISREAELKGNLVGILVKQVTWPANRVPTTAIPLTIGIIGNDPFVDNGGTNYLKKRLQGTGAVVLNFPDETAYQDCHVLVVSKAANFQKALEKTTGSPVLVVSESPGLAGKGAAMNLVFDMAKNQIRLEINPGTARDSKLEINPHFLRSELVQIVNK
ncbi:MAG: YfiR family protein [Planctomycetota bacterium]